MAMGKKKRRQQEDLWVATSELPRTAGHPFYERLNGLFNEHGFDDFVEGLCAKFYADKMGRPSLAPGVYFRLLLVGYFEGIGSERGIAWRASDSLGLREFLGLKVSESPFDHSTISRTRRLIDVATHEAVFDWVLKRIGASGLLRGKTIGIDATTLEAKAALRSIVRRDSEQGYEEFLMELAKASGIETPRREDLAKLDRKRTGKGSNRVWKHPHDADARITRMKDGRTHLAHKAEHAVDLETGAIVSVTVQGADRGDTQTMVKTLTEAAEKVEQALPEGRGIEEVVARQGVSQHAADGGPGCGGIAQLCERTEAREATLARRPAGAGSGVCESAAPPGRARGQRLLRQRGERLERPCAHLYGSGGMRRLHVRGHENVLKRLLIQVSAFNLGMLMRQSLGVGTPRGLQGRICALMLLILSLFKRLKGLFGLTPAARPGLCAVRAKIYSVFFRGSEGHLNGRVPENVESTGTQSMKLGFLRHRWASVAIIATALVGPNNLPAISELELRESNPASTSSPAPYFEERILPILKVNCVRCHDSQTSMAGLDLSSRKGIFKGSASGRVLVAGEPEDSRLLKVVQEGLMPADGRTSLSDEEIETIRAWIERLGGSWVADAESGLPKVTHHDIVPIMLLHCTACHGERYQEGGLDLRNRASMLKGGKSGPVMVLGRPDESLILKLVREGKMPPKEREVEANVRTMGVSEINLLKRWIALGAPEAPAAEMERSGTQIDVPLSREAQQFWAFQSVPEVEVPKLERVEDRVRVRNPIDAFIVRKLEKRRLSLSPEADRLTLMRRAYFDLTGLPPEPEEVEIFLLDRAPHAYEKLIDRLLASPRYGERWARYWLDLAGYEDWPHAYRYRDYVIRSFNADKSYDRFLQEQIAGDELVDYESAQVVDQGIMDNLVATGFLRMAPDSTGARLTNFVEHRVQVISDEIAILSSSVLSLTLQCARCHDHKFDPISQSDYYRLAATLKGALDEHDWLPPSFSDDPNRPALVKESRLLPYVTPLANPLRLDTERRQREANNDKLRKEIGALRAVLEKKAEPLKEKIISGRLAKVPQVLHEDLRKMLATPAEERSEFQKYLAEKFEESFEIHAEELNAMDEGYRKAAEEVGKRIKLLQSRVLPEPQIRALWDRGKPSPTYVLRRGDPMSSGRWVQPGVPAFLDGGRIPFEVKPPWPGAKKTGRRLALARWLTHPDHPLTVRVMANRIWRHHFGRGIVQTLGNFGHTGARPTHPELLDWLARKFMQLGWSVKAVHRLIMTSATYRQTSTVGLTQASIDPDNILLSRMPMRRMDAEVLRDTLFLVAGRLNETPFGPPEPVQEREDGLATSIGGDQGWRRSIYVEQHNGHRRGQSNPTILEKFDFPQMTPNCVERVESTAVPQALHLLNNRLVRDLSESFASRVKSEVGSDPQRQIERAYLIALSRPSGDDERSVGLEALTKLSHVEEQSSHANREDTSTRSLAKFCHTLINSAGFIFID